MKLVYLLLYLIVFGNATLRHLSGEYRRFGGIYCLHLMVVYLFVFGLVGWVAGGLIAQSANQESKYGTN
jgi:hypothetical protein